MSFICASGHVAAEKVYPVRVVKEIRPVEYKIVPPRAKGVFPFTTRGYETVKEEILCPACAAGRNGSEPVMLDEVHYVEHRLRQNAEERRSFRRRNRDEV